MPSLSSEERQQLNDSLQELLGDKYSFEHWKKLARTPGGEGFGRAEWKQFADMGWLGIAATGAHLRLSPRSDALARRAGSVFLALTIPVLWARILFASASNTILGLDARLIGWVVGTRSHGNTIDLANGTGVIFLEPACSSLTNLSLVILCGVLFVKGQGCRWSAGAVAAIAAAGAVTVAINVLRIALIGVMPQHYAEIHGLPGAAIATWATIAAMLAIFSYGIGIGGQARP